jgi:hypothetical protein
LRQNRQRRSIDRSRRLVQGEKRRGALRRSSHQNPPPVGFDQRQRVARGESNAFQNRQLRSGAAHHAQSAQQPSGHTSELPRSFGWPRIDFLLHARPPLAPESRL